MTDFFFFTETASVFDHGYMPTAKKEATDRAEATDTVSVLTRGEAFDDTPVTGTVRNPFISGVITSDDQPLVN